ncbi:MAG: hypothetical protein IPK26_08070, partial [Planctomycetes bacterium]|nr:hypothetical protein [Planctomycetota bacterium]
MQTPAQVLLALATGKVELLLTTGDHAPADLQAMLQAAHKQAVAPLLAVAAATNDELERALRLGCRGLLARDADDARLR